MTGASRMDHANTDTHKGSRTQLRLDELSLQQLGYPTASEFHKLV